MPPKTGRLEKTRHSAAAQGMRAASRQRKGGKAGLRLPRRLQLDVRAEARALGLTNEEYLRLLLALSKSLRKGLFKQQNIDAKAVLQLAESPVFGGLIQYVAESAKSLTSSKEKDESASEEPEQGQQLPANSQGVHPQTNATGMQGLQGPRASARPPWAQQQGPLQPQGIQNPAQRAIPYGFVPYTAGQWPSQGPSTPRTIPAVPRAEQARLQRLPVRAYLP